MSSKPYYLAYELILNIFEKNLDKEYEKYSEIINKITQIKSNLKYCAPEIMGDKFVSEIVTITPYLPEKDKEETKWALDAWNKMCDQIKYLNKLINK